MKSAIILSDSRSVLQALESSFRSGQRVNHIIQQIKFKLAELNNVHFSINFVRVKAHLGLKYNEEMDILAGNNNLDQLGEEKVILEDAICLVKDQQKVNWSQQWNEYISTISSRYASIYPELRNNA
ncbi:hypothetical protein Trydic_g12535 [Trypoxylus dichotomus]